MKNLGPNSGQPVPIMPPNSLNRFLSKIKKSENCWLWVGSKKKSGYGIFCLFGKSLNAHRVSFSHFKTTLLPGHLVLHTCNNPSCVNPEHLILGDQTENMRHKVESGRHHNKNKTHCKRGHKLAGKNLSIVSATKYRRCLACQRLKRSMNLN